MLSSISSTALCTVTIASTASVAGLGVMLSADSTAVERGRMIRPYVSIEIAVSIRILRIFAPLVTVPCPASFHVNSARRIAVAVVSVRSACALNSTRTTSLVRLPRGTGMLRRRIRLGVIVRCWSVRFVGCDLLRGKRTFAFAIQISALKFLPRYI